MGTAAVTSLDRRPAYRGGAPLFAPSFRFIKPTLPPLETVTGLYRDAYASGMVTNAALVERLEATVCERLGVRHCVAVSSCTSGLMLVLKALGVSGEVIVPAFTFFATGHSVLWNGLQPVFADCLAEGWNLDPRDVERKLSARTGAILGVHLYGNPADTGALAALARGRNVPLLFDAAHAFGSSSGGRMVGSFGDAEVFSLSPTKLLVAGEGGLVTTNDAVLARRLRAGRNYGDLGAYNPEMLGLNARMGEFNAALALAGLALVDEKVKAHNRIASLYTESLAGIPGLSFQSVLASDVSSYKDYSVLVDPVGFGMDRDQLAAALLAENLPTKKYFYPPLHEQTLFAPWMPAAGSLPCTERISRQVLSLPIYHSLDEEIVKTVAVAIRRIQASLGD